MPRRLLHLSVLALLMTLALAAPAWAKVPRPLPDAGVSASSLSALGDVSASAPGLAVYRFTDIYNGSQYFTASEADRAYIMANLYDVYEYNGVFCYSSLAGDTLPIYRMYNKVDDTYSLATAYTRWAMLTYLPYAWEDDFSGPAFYASPTNAGAGYVPVYRFLGRAYPTQSREMDTYMHVADPVEKSVLQSVFGDWYYMEGVDFYVVPGNQAVGTGSISGTVTGPAGQPLAHILVHATAQYSAGTYSGVTNASGAYQITGVPAGNYFVSFNVWPRFEDMGTWSFAPLYYQNAHAPNSFTQVAVNDSGVTANINARLRWMPQPVYRFYNDGNSTHFFTPSFEEAVKVIETWPDIFDFEGVAYYTNPGNNTQPLFRFYNRNSSSHFYTASPDEAAQVMAKWSHVFAYDGPTYAVNPTPVANSVPAFRFYNKRNGSHFYTASAEERDTVIAKWSNVYTFEGPAFWIGQ